MKKTTLVLGASLKPSRYSNLAIHRLESHGHPIIAIGLKEGIVGQTSIQTKIDLSELNENLHTITLYLNPELQQAYYPLILGSKAKRIIFNPGTENLYLMEMAGAQGMETLEACTLVMLSSNQY